MDFNRDQFLEDGFVILRGVIPPQELDGLRRAYEELVERQKVIWARERGPDDPPGGVWETHAQPRLNLMMLAGEIDAQTVSAVEIWLHENTQGVSSRLLGVEDAAVTEMMLMCNPVRDHETGGHRGWHRDFYPPHTAPLQGYADDILEKRTALRAMEFAAVRRQRSLGRARQPQSSQHGRGERGDERGCTYARAGRGPDSSGGG